MTWQLLSAAVILSAPVLIGGYDLVAYLVSGNDATISKISLTTAHDHPAYMWSVCFLFGELCGHLFAPARASSQLPPWLSLVLFVGFPLVVAFGSLLAEVHSRMMGVSGNDYPVIQVMLFLVVGALIGAAYLPQSDLDGVQ